jgi:hypothetical protein
LKSVHILQESKEFVRQSEVNKDLTLLRPKFKNEPAQTQYRDIKVVDLNQIPLQQAKERNDNFRPYQLTQTFKRHQLKLRVNESQTNDPRSDPSNVTGFGPSMTTSKGIYTYANVAREASNSSKEKVPDPNNTIKVLMPNLPERNADSNPQQINTDSNRADEDGHNKTTSELLPEAEA